MTERHNKPARSRARQVFLSMAVVLILAGCQSPPGVGDPRDEHPLKVVDETVSVSIGDRVGGGPLLPLEQVAFDRFVHTYVLRGKGVVAMQSFGDGESEHAARYQRAYELLRRAGVDAGHVFVAPGKPAGEGRGRVVLSFLANAVKVPECGDWSSTATNDWSNRRHANFGCAYQRNLGLTIANPGDLNSAQPLSPYEGPRGSTVIGIIRSGGGGSTTTTTSP